MGLFDQLKEAAKKGNQKINGTQPAQTTAKPLPAKTTETKSTGSSGGWLSRNVGGSTGTTQKKSTYDSAVDRYISGENQRVQPTVTIGNVGQKPVTFPRSGAQTVTLDSIGKNNVKNILKDDKIGQYGKGNIDLYNRKPYVHPNGDISTVYSLSFEQDGQTILVPTIIDGKLVNEDEAIRHYDKTGEYLGKFNTQQEADDYAALLHDQQEQLYTGNGPLSTQGQWGKNKANIKYDLPDTRTYTGKEEYEGDTYGNLKGSGKGAGWFDFGKYFDPEYIRSTDPQTYWEAMTYRKENRNKGLWDNEPYATIDMLSDRKRQELLQLNRNKADELERMLNGEGIDEMKIPADAVMPKEMAGRYGSVQEYVNGRAEQLKMMISRDSIPGADDVAMPIGAGGYNGDRREIGKAMYRYLYGNESLQREMSKNGGQLSGASQEAMMRLFDSQENRSDKEKTRDLYRNRAETVQKYIDTEANANSIVAQGQRYLSGEEKAEAPANEWWDVFNVTDNGQSKAQQIYDFFTPGTDTNYLLMQNAGDYTGDKGDVGRVFDHAFYYLPDEQKVFMDLMDAGKVNEALAFHQGMVDSGILEYRYNQRENDVWTMMSDIAPVSSGLATVATKAVEPAVAVVNFADSLLGDKSVDRPYSDRNALVNMNTAIRGNIIGNVQNAVTEATGNETLGRYAGAGVGGIFSALDNVRQFAVGKFAAGILQSAGVLAQGAEAFKDTAQAITLGQMFGDVYENTRVQELKNDPKNPDKAKLLGALAAGQEIFWEKIGDIDLPFKEGLTTKNYVLSTYLGELFEEEGGNVSDMILQPLVRNMYDLATTGETDGYSQIDMDAMELMDTNEQQYTNADGTLDWNRAYKDAWTNRGKEAIETAFSTAVSTGPMAMGTTMDMRRENKQFGEALEKNGQVKDFAELVLNSTENEETKQRIAKIQEKLEKGAKISKAELGSIYKASMNETNERVQQLGNQILQRNIREYLRENYTNRGGEATVDPRTQRQMSEIITKAVNEGRDSLSYQERSLLEQYPAAMELMKDMTANETGEKVDPMKRSAGMLGEIAGQTKEAARGLTETARQLGEMAKTQAQKHIDSLREEYAKYQKMQQRAGDAVKTAGEKMADGETVKNFVGRMWENAKARTAEARANGTLGEETGPKSEEEVKRKTVVFTDENGQETGGTLVGVETKVVDVEPEQKKGPRTDRPQNYVAQDAEREGPAAETTAENTTAENAPEQKAGPRTDRPAGYVAQDADREGTATTAETAAENAPAAETTAETAPEAEQKAPSKKRLVRQYVVRTADGTEIRTDAVTAKAADAATAAAMTFIETSDMSDREASDLLDVVTSEGVPIGDMEALLKDARNVMTRGWLGMTFPAEIGYKPEAARALYEKGQAQKITDEETRTGGRRTTLNPGQGQVTYRGVDVKTLDGEVRKQVEAAAAIAKRVGYNIIFENDTKNTNRYGEYDAATGSVIINIAGKHQNGQAHHLMVAMSHEVTHMLERNSQEAYAQLREFVFKEMQRNGVDLVARIGQKVDNYNYQIRQMRQNGRNISDITIGGAAAEVVADACDQVFGNEKLITRLANENPTLFDKVKNAIADFIGKVRDAARGMRESGSLDSATIRDVDKLAEKWGIALEEVRTGVAPAAAESQQNAENAAEAQLSVMELDNGIKIAVEDRNILIDKPASTSMADYIREYIWSQIKSKNGRAIVEATGDVVFLSKDLPGEYTESRYTKQLQRGNRKKYDIKGRMAGVLLDMIKTANNKTGPEIVKHNNGKAAQRGVYKFATKVALPVTNNGEINGYNVYNAKLIVNHSGNGKMELYDVYDINKDDATTVLLNRRANTYKGGQPDSAVTKGSINQNDGKSNNQLSLAEAERESGYENEKMARASVATDQNGERIFSLASMEHDRDLYRQMLVGSGILKDKEIEDLFQTIDKAMGTIRKDRAILDMNETFGKDERAFLPVKPNSDPLYQVSLDFSTLCRKRLLQQALQEMIEKKYKTVMTKAERVAMRNALQQLQKEGKRIEIACALCYVESARLKSPAQIQKFMENKRGYIVDYLSKSKKDYKQKIDAAEAAMKESFGYDAKTSLKEIKKKNSAHERAIRAMKRRMYQEYAPTAQEESIIRAAETMDESMYKTAAGLAKLKRDYPMVFDAFTTSVRNATKSKGIEGDTPFYAGDTKSISDELIERMNKENGLRSQSWSDFQTYHILDYMGAIIELSTRKAKMQAYTKVPDYIRLMGLTGQMINASLIPMDYNGENLQYDPKEGMPYEIAQELRDLYADTVGNICIGISDDHIRALLASDDIDYVIPYHKSSMDKKTRQRMGLKNWSEYESQQNEKPQDYADTDKKGKDYQKKPDFSEWYNYQEASEIARAFEASGMSAWDASKLAMQEMANRYIQLCHERGLQEKFANFSGEDGYWKLLIDRKMINQKTGKLIEQQAVRPIFDSAVIEDILKNEVQQVRETQPDIEEATDEILKQWEAGDIQKAARTKEVQDAVRAFDDHMVVQNVVELFRDEQQNRTAPAAAETETTEETEDTEEDMPIAAAMSLADISEIQEKQQELYRTRERVHEIENSKELQDAITKAMKEGDFDDYNEILSRTKLADLKRKVSRLEDEIQKWQKEYEEERNRKNLSREQQAIAKSGLTEPEYRNRQAVKQFGTTTNPNEAAYIIRNGSMLNFSGEKGQHTNHRGNDHRMIGIIYEDDNIQGSKAMYTFMNDGNIRIMPESPGIEVTSRTEPTAEQYRTLRRVINQIGGDGFSIDFCDENGHNIDSIMYDGRANGEKAIADIKHFYETGEVRQPSELSRFFSVAENGMAATDWIMAMDPNDIDMGTKAEKALVRNYQRTRREVESIEARIAEMKEALKTAKGDEARKLRINLQTEQNKLKRARDMLNGLTSGREFSYMLRRAQESISYLMGMKSQEDVNKAADRMRDKAEEMRRTATEAAGMLEKIADREEAAVQRRYFNNDALRGAAAELGEYFGIKDTSRIEDGLVEIGLKMIAKDPGFAESLDRMSSRILEDMYGTAALMEGSNNKEVYGSQLSDITVQVLKATQKYVPGLKDANITSADRAEVRGLLDYVKQVGSMTRQAAAGMQRVAGMAQELKQETENTKAATAEIRRKLATAIRYYDNLNKQSDALASAERMERTIRQIESKAAKQVLEAQMKFAHTLENDRNVRRLANENLRARHRINTAYTRMAKLILNESDQKNIPAHMQPIARAAIRMILNNDTAGRKLTGQDWQTLIRSRNTVELIDKRDGTELNLNALVDFELIDQGGDDVAVAIEEALQEIDEGIRYWNSGNGRTAVALEGDKAALARISKGMTQIYDIVTRSQQIFLDGKQVDLANAAYEVDAEARKKEAYREFTGGLGKLVKGMNKNAVLANMTPEYFFKNLKNNGLSRIFEEFKNGEDRYGRILLEAKQKIEAAAEKAGYGSWDMDAKHAIQLDNGRTVNMTLGQMMSLMATWKRENTLGPEMSQHLTKGGFVIEEKSEKKIYGREAKNQTPNRVTEHDMEEIGNMLTAEQKTYVDEMVQILTKDMGRYGNEASMRMYGIEKYKETYYFPFQIWSGVKNKDSAAGSVNPTNNNRAAHMSFTNRRKANASNAVMIRDFNQVCAEHINQMATYATFGSAIEGMNRVLNYRIMETGEDGIIGAVERNIENLLVQQYGEDAVNYLRQFMKDLNGGAVQKNTDIGQRLMSMFKKNAVGGSLSVALQQPLSYIRASTMIEVKNLQRADARCKAHIMSREWWKNEYEEMAAHSGVAVIKDMGKFDMSFSMGAADWLTPDNRETGIRKVYNKVEEITNALPEKMDQITWIKMWNAIKIEQAAANPGVDQQSDEFLDAVGKRFNDVMRKTQVYDSVLVKSELMRNTGWVAKTITAFRAEPTVTLNMFMDAWMNRKEAGGKKNAAAVMATFLLGAIAQAAVKGIMGAGRNPDEKKTLAENFAYRFGSAFMSEANPLELIPGMDNIITALSGNDINDNAWGMIKTFSKSLKTVFNPPTGEKLTLDSGYRYIEDTVGQITQMMSGVPAKNLMRDSRAVYNWFLGEGYSDREHWGKDKDGNRVRIPGRERTANDISVPLLGYANRNVMKYQMFDQLAGDSLMAMLNATTVLNVWDSSSTAYTQRIYEAERDGNRDAADAYREYMTLGKGKEKKDIDSAVASAAKKDSSLTTVQKAEFLLENEYTDKTTWITEQFKKGEMTEDEVRELYKKYFPDKVKNLSTTFWNVVKDAYKAGDISRAEAERRYKQYYPKANANDIFSTFDALDYTKDTGKTASGDYYRMHDAIEQNNSAEIAKAVESLTKHGKKKNGFESSIKGKWMTTYNAMQNGSAEKVRLRDGITKAMKAAGFSTKEIDKMFTKWAKTAEKEKK